VYSWGYGKHGELGLGPQVKQQLVPVHVSGSGSESNAVRFHRRLKGGGSRYSEGSVDSERSMDESRLFVRGGGAWGAEGVEGVKRWERRLRGMGYVQVAPRSRQSEPRSERMVVVADVVCGTAHTVLLSDAHDVYTCGFGGTGRLGHLETRDCFRPTSVVFWRQREEEEDEEEVEEAGGGETKVIKVSSIGAGPSCTLLRTYSPAEAAGTSRVVLFGQCCVNPCMHSSNDPLVEPVHEPMCFDPSEIVMDIELAHAQGS
jgi:hypothetical protein